MLEVRERLIRNRRGLNLFVRIHLAESPKALIVTSHGLFAHQGDCDGKYYLLATEAVARGYTVIRFDYTGRGRSEGTFIESTIGNRIDDLEDVIRASGRLVEFDHPLKLILVGGSMGGAVSICLAARSPGLISAIVTWAAPADMAWNLEQINAPLAALLKTGETADVVDRGVTYTLTPEYYDSYTDHVPLDEIRKTGGIPKLIIHGKADTEVPPRNAELLYEAAPDPKQLVFYPNAEHRFTGYERELIADTLQWLDEKFRHYEVNSRV